MGHDSGVLYTRTFHAHNCVMILKVCISDEALNLSGGVYYRDGCNQPLPVSPYIILLLLTHISIMLHN